MHFARPRLAQDLSAWNEFGSENGARTLQIDAISRMILAQLQGANALSGKLKELSIESKILDLIYRYSCRNAEISGGNFENFENLGAKNPDAKFEIRAEISSSGLSAILGVKFCEHDLRAIEKSREILLSDLKNPPSIKALARSCAINEFKLKKGFKALFGTTICAALQQERLKIAHELLRKGDINVSQASAFVGYKSLSHFSQIFKDCYKILPTEFIKNTR